MPGLIPILQNFDFCRDTPSNGFTGNKNNACRMSLKISRFMYTSRNDVKVAKIMFYLKTYLPGIINPMQLEFYIFSYQCVYI